MATENTSSRNLVLGIDTGGTYTDGILLDYQTRQVLASHKSLTTKRDFSIGIEKVIEGIHIEDPSEIKMVSISTTLATNAIAEGKGKRVALFLIGYDPELISSFKMEHRFATPNFYFFEGGHNLYGQEKATLDLPGILAKINQIKDTIDAIAVSSYFSPLNPEHENRVQQAMSGVCDLPIVLSHQLSTKLGSIERATTAALNASLLAILQDFVIAVRRAMEHRHIEAPLMVVRGDGTLMSDEFASRTPVETIHSGPAASAIGGRFLSGLDDALIVDVGGTTTDIALITNGQVAVSEDGATVGSYKTAVKAANLLSIALGGDSHITLSGDKNITVGPERVIPLCYLGDLYPQVHSRLRTLSRRTWTQSSPEWLEYWVLLREPRDEALIKTAETRALVDLLRDGPQALPEIVQHLGLLHAAQIGAGELLRHEIVGKAGITPTDLMHSAGTLSLWDNETATQVWNVFSRFQFEDPGQLQHKIWAQITETIVRAIVTFLTGREFNPASIPRGEDMGCWFFHNSLYNIHPQLETSIKLRQPIIGIGAPAAVFLKPVAEALHTELVLPDCHWVANAVGAVAGSVMVEEEVLVYPRLSSSGLEVLGYFVQTTDSRDEFEEMNQALAYARFWSREHALGAAVRSGADHPQVTVVDVSDGLDTYRIRAKAIGNPRLGG